MFETWRSYPFGVAFALFYVVILLRGQATYWIARAVTTAALRNTLPAGGWRARVHAWLSARVQGRGTDVIERYGLAAIPLAHLTVGLQTVVLAGAGVLRIAWLRFTVAQALGGAAWATIYTTIGFAVWEATLVGLAGQPWVIVLLALAAASVVVLVVRRRSHAVAPSRSG